MFAAGTVIVRDATVDYAHADRAINTGTERDVGANHWPGHSGRSSGRPAPTLCTAHCVRSTLIL